MDTADEAPIARIPEFLEYVDSAVSSAINAPVSTVSGPFGFLILGVLAIMMLHKKRL